MNKKDLSIFTTLEIAMSLYEWNDMKDY